MSSQVSLENPLNITNYNELDSTTMEAYIYDNLHHTLSRSYMRLFIKNICGNSLLFALWYDGHCLQFKRYPFIDL